MTRRELLRGIVLYQASQLLGGPQESPGLTKFPGTKFRDYSRCVPDYLAALAAEATRKRNAELSKLTTREAIEVRQRQVRELLWKLIGGTMERTPLYPKTTGTLARAGYTVEKIIYQTRPGLFVSANLYTPKSGAGPFPAVLFQSGHYWEAKAYPSYQRCCQGLVRLGFVVLAFDPMGQGERVNYLDGKTNASRLSSCDAEHTTPGKQMLLFGDSATRFQLWDATRSLDFLLSLPIVDKNHVASIGHSGGATLTMLLAASDERLSAAAVCMGNTENFLASHFRSPGATDDAEQDFVSGGPAGFDRWDLLYPIAPKPLLIWPSDRDFFATYSPDYVANGWEEYQRLRKVYEKLNHPEHLAWADTPLPHALAYDSRMLVYNWFTKWLKGDSAGVEREPDTNPEPVSDLWATESGNVIRSLKSATPFSLIIARHVQHDSAPLESLLKIDRPAHGATAKVIGRVKSRNVAVEVLEIPSSPSVWLPAFVITQDNMAATKPVLLVLDPRGNDPLWFSPEVDRILPGECCVICAADLRGLGSVTPEFSPGAAEYEEWHQQEENYAWGSLYLGKPLVGQRVSDILSLTQALSAYPGTAGRPIFVAASGKLTVPALFAAALEPAIKGLYLNNGLVSFQNLIETEVYHHPFANFVPDLLNHTDLPDIAASLAPRRLVLAGPIDASGGSVSPAVANGIYRAAASAGNLSIQARSEWSAEAVVGFANQRPPG